MIAALLLALAQAPQLSPELLVAHPTLFDGRYAEARELQLQALEADPNSRWAYAAIRSIRSLNSYCGHQVDPARLEALARETRNAHVQLSVLRMLESDVRRKRFSDSPYEIDGDLFSDFFDHWLCIGPLGRLDEPAVLWSQGADSDPHRVLSPEYIATNGQALQWRPVHRKQGSIGVFPERELHPSSGGTSFLLAFVEAPRNEALLEVWSERALQVYWNGELVHEELRAGLTRQDSRATIPLRLASGPNALVIRMQNGDSAVVGARLLNLDGTVLENSIESLDTTELALTSWPATAPAKLNIPVEEHLQSVPFERTVDMMVAIAASRQDKALAVPRPENAEEIPAWLRMRHLAVRNASHLPAEVHRRFLLSIEAELDELGLKIPEIRAGVSERYMNEDQAQEALRIAEKLVAEHPQTPPFHWLHHRTLSALDDSGTLTRVAALETLEVLDDASSWRKLAADAGYREDAASVRKYMMRAVAADGGDSDVVVQLLDFLFAGTENDLTLAEGLIRRWRASEPFSSWLEDYEFRAHAMRREYASIQAGLEDRISRREYQPSNWVLLAAFHLRHGNDDAARTALNRVLAMTPDDLWARKALAQLGDAGEAEQFFREFGPDREEALTLRDQAAGASTALILDSRMIFVREDGSTHNRTHQITLAIDRTGTEQLQEQPQQGETRVAQVLGSDGKIYEPILVDSSWVMPSLDPGDCVENVFDHYTEGAPGDAPDLGMWTFESFEQPFLLSRLVVYLPAGTPGRWEMESFAGIHAEVAWGNGTVHIFEMSERPRLEPEIASPSPPELLSWVDYGDDYESEFLAQYFLQDFAWQQDVADDVAVELRALADRVSAASDKSELARKLFEAVSEHVIAFDQSGDTTDVWYLERGNPTGLLAALYDMTGVAYEWAVPYPSAPPELDPNPARAFLTPNDVGAPWLRIANEDGEPTWLFIPDGGRGYTFGRIPDSLGGTRMLVMSSDGSRLETLPSPPEDSWQVEVEIDIAIQDDKSAKAKVRFLMLDITGPLTRERLAQTEPQNREQAVRQMVARIVPGIDVEAWEIRNLNQRGADFEIVAEGTVSRFVRGSRKKPYFKLPWPHQRLSRFVGDGERNWPLALRTHTTERSTLQVHGCDAWRIAPTPESQTIERPGLYFQIQLGVEDNTLTAQQSMRIHGLSLPAEDVPELAKEIKAIEDLDTARFPLTPKE